MSNYFCVHIHIYIYIHIISQELDQGNKVKYYRALAAVRCKKQAADEECPLLTYIDIQDCIDAVNQQCQIDDEGIFCVNCVHLCKLYNIFNFLMS